MKDKLKLKLLKDKNAFRNLVSTILRELIFLDQTAKQLSIDSALASRELVKELWEFLPEERFSHRFVDINQQTEKGRALLSAQDFDEIVNIHFGWDILCFECSLNAAWFAWEKFCQSSTETFNCCIYPGSLDWFVVRAGRNLYPMRIRNGKYEIKKNQ